jgi:hypothetical protein
VETAGRLKCIDVPALPKMSCVQRRLQNGPMQHAAVRRPNAQCWWRRELLLAKDDPSERGRVISDRAAEATKSSARGRFSESYSIEQVHCACFEFGFRTVCAVAHRTSQMLRTMGLLPVWTGLRGSTVAFSGVHCRGSGSSHAA